MCGATRWGRRTNGRRLVTRQAPIPLLRNRPLLRRIALYGGRHRGRLLGLCVLTSAAAILLLLQPLLLRHIIDELIADADVAALYLPVVLVMIAGLLGVGCTLLADRLAASTAFRIIGELQTALFEHLSRLPFGFFTTVQPGAIVSRLTNDVYAVEPLFTTVLSKAVADTVTLVGAGVVLALIDIRLAFLLLLVPVAIYPIRYIESRINALLFQSFTLNSELSTQAESVLNRDAMLLARQAGGVQAEARRFNQLVREVREMAVRLAAWRAGVSATYGAAFVLTTSAMLGVGAWAVTAGDISIGTLVLFLLYFRQIQSPLMELIGLRYPAIRAGAAFQRVFDVLDSDLRPVAASRAPRVVHHVPLAFDGVSYRYPDVSEVSIPGLSHTQAVAVAGFSLTSLAGAADDARSLDNRDVLTGISFTVQRGEFVAIVGASGVGKSTIAMLAAGIITPSSGKVLVGGHDTTSIDDATVAKAVSLISQETHILHASIAENLRYVRSGASDAEVGRACRAAHLTEFIERLPNGYDTIVGEKGYRLSGGQRQRLAIARALLKDTELVVLDEPTSQLDAETEALVKQSIAAAFKEKAVVMLAHRLTTIIDADRILVLEGGRVVESGTHHELIARTSGGRYATLFRTQVSPRDSGNAAVMREQS